MLTNENLVLSNVNFMNKARMRYPMAVANNASHEHRKKVKRINLKEDTTAKVYKEIELRTYAFHSTFHTTQPSICSSLRCFQPTVLSRCSSSAGTDGRATTGTDGTTTATGTVATGTATAGTASSAGSWSICCKRRRKRRR